MSVLKFVLVCVVLVLAAHGLANAGTNRSEGDCHKIFPKGGNAIVHGVVVPLAPREYLKLCKGKPVPPFAPGVAESPKEKAAP